MTTRRMAGLIVASLLSLSATADDTTASAPGPGPAEIYKIVRPQLGQAPAGFDWAFFENAGFLKPNGWFEHTLKSVGQGVTGDTYAASPTDFSVNKPFETGFTVIHYANLEKFHKPAPSDSAKIMVKTLLDSHQKEDVKYLSASKRGDFELTYFRYRDAPPGLTPIIVHQFYLANDTTDNLDIFIFESPEDQWDKNWADVGHVLLSKTFMIPNFPAP